MRALILASATGLTAVFLLPQLFRVLRTRDTAGLSTSWATFGFVTNLAWIVYLGRLGLWPAVMAPTLALVTYGIILLALIKKAPRREWIGATGVYTTVLVTVGSWGGIEALGIVLVLAPVVQLTPAIAAAYRERLPTGISPTTWLLSTCEALLWAWYGWLVRDIALVGYGLITGFGSLLILRRWLSTRPRLRAATTGAA